MKGMPALRRIIASILLACVAGFSAFAETADPRLDAPEGPRPSNLAFKDARSYSHALALWQSPEDINAWIGAKFQYDMARAMALSENQRGASGRLPIHSPQDFFAAPSGICVDLSRFAVETI